MTKLLREQISTRKERVLSASTYYTFQGELRIFFNFVKSKTVLSAIFKDLDSNRKEFESEYSKMSAVNKVIWPATEKERAILCLTFLEYFMNSSEKNELLLKLARLRIFGTETNHDKQTSIFLKHFFEPFYEYLDSVLEEKSIPFQLLQRYKARVEWFEKDNLLSQYQEASKHQKGEQVLDKALRQFLFDQGIDYPFSQPKSPSGQADIVVGLETNDPLVLEVKLFDNAQYNKAYVRKGFRQAIKYANDYNKSTGYLVVYNISEHELRFSLASKDDTAIEIDGKHIFIITIDIAHRPSASKDREDPVTITQEYLLQQNEGD